MTTTIIKYVSATLCVLLGLSGLRTGLGMISRQTGWGLGLTAFALVCFATAAVIVRLVGASSDVEAPAEEQERVPA